MVVGALAASPSLAFGNRVVLTRLSGLSSRRCCMYSVSSMLNVFRVGKITLVSLIILGNFQFNL
jgi:hypothetical protein